MSREYLVHIRERVPPEQRGALLARFPESRPSAKAHLHFPGKPSAAPRAIVDFARGLGLHVRMVAL